MVNSLGMKFVPVPATTVLMSIWETRVQEYEVFVNDAKVEFLKRTVQQGPEYPVVSRTWDEAKAFCEWLSRREGKTYRLPTDHEWSLAVGIGDREDPKASPKDKDGKIKGVYPWGTQWPPPAGAGNYMREREGSLSIILSPVGTFPPNRLGIYDLGGNVWEWCEDTYEPIASSHVLRGASVSTYSPHHLLSSYRYTQAPTSRILWSGFRCVLVVSGP
jgi:formylglycine-generating enzyme required for sulfatase activity